MVLDIWKRQSALLRTEPGFEGEYFVLAIVYASLILLTVLRYCIAAMFTNFETVMSSDTMFMGEDGFVTGNGVKS